MKKIYFIFLFTLAFYSTSCDFGSKQTDDFYTATKDLDLWRVPLLKPYEVVSPGNDEAWFLILEKPDLSGPDFALFGEEFQLTNITRLGIKDSIIVIENKEEYWPKLSGMYPSVLIVDAKTNHSFIYSKEHHQQAIKAKYKELKLEGINIYDWTTIKNDFQKNGNLPEDWTK